jgi:hypothetical protein
MQQPTLIIKYIHADLSLKELLHIVTIVAKNILESDFHGKRRDETLPFIWGEII